MDGGLISKILKEDPFASNIFEGIYTIDTLPPKIKKPYYAIVVNSDILGNPGLHWVALYGTPTHLIYYDSLGPTLINNPHLINFIVKHSEKKKFVLSLQPTQSIVSTTCGFYVLTFILYMARGYTLCYFETLFDYVDLLKNDRTVCMLLMRKYKDIMRNANCGITI
jgi:hypothetical protein